MALKTSSLAAALLMVAAIAPPAVSQKLGNVIVSGTVPCSSVAVNVTLTTAVFANATVMLQCGQDTVGITVSNRNGAFSLLIAANVTTILFPAPLAGCRLVVPTPLSACNPSLQSNVNGTLQATLQLLQGNVSLGGVLGPITNLVPSGFHLMT